MAEMGLAPAWRYKNGVNTLELRLKRKGIGNVAGILIALGLAVGIGFLSYGFMSEGVRGVAVELILAPLQKIFFGLLSVFAGLMILFSVTGGIFNMGDMSTFNKVGKLMLGRLVGITFVVAGISSIVSYFLFRPEMGGGGMIGLDKKGLSELMDMIYDIIPQDPVTMFMTGNAMQIIFVGVIFGLAILVLGERVNRVRNLIEETNLLITNILSVICKFLPFYIFVTILKMIWSGTFLQIISIWKPLVASCVVLVLMLLAVMLYVSVRYKVGVINLAKKLMPSFLICITSASSISAYGQVINDSVKKLGIKSRFVEVMHPISAVIYMPGFVVEFSVLTYFLAKTYDVKISMIWIIMGAISMAVFSMAMPPIPGASLIAFGIMFARMGIPEDALALAVTCDLFCDFLNTAVDVSMGMMEYVIQADKVGALDKKVLQSKV